MMSQDDNPRRRPDIETHILPDGSCLLYDPNRDDGYALNAAGALVWDCCDGTLTVTQIVDELSGLLPEHPEVANDTQRLLRALADQGLLLPTTAVAGT